MIIKSKRNLLIYGCVFGVLLIPSIILACFKIYDLLIVVSFTYTFGFLSLVFLELSSNGILTGNIKQSLLFTLLRFTSMILSIVLPAITIYFTSNNLIYILGSAAIMTLLLVSTVFLKEPDNNDKFDLFNSNNSNIIDVKAADDSSEAIDVEIVDSNNREDL